MFLFLGEDLTNVINFQEFFFPPENNLAEHQICLHSIVKTTYTAHCLLLKKGILKNAFLYI